MGPGLITGNVDNDAGGIATYSLAGAQFGYALMWTLIPTTLALIVVQEMCARMGVVTGKGLAALIREEFGVRMAFTVMGLLLISNLGNIIAEFAGIAAGLELFHLNKYVTVPLAAFAVWRLVVKGTYRVVEKVFLASSALLRSTQKMSPWSWFVPDLVTVVTVPSPLNSALLVTRLAANSCTDSMEGCDTESGLPKFPKTVSIPSTLSRSPFGPAPGVSQYAPFPICTTPGTVIGIIVKIKPASPALLEILRRFVGSSMICRVDKPATTDGVSYCTAVDTVAETVT